MSRRQQRLEAAAETYRVTSGFTVSDGAGGLRSYPPGVLISGTDPLATTHSIYLEPVSTVVEAATAAPGERRNLRLPSGRSLADVTRHREGHAHKNTDIGGADMAPHRNSLDPSDVNSPASPFAPAQPAAGVVAPDVPPEQNLAGGPKPEEVNQGEVDKFVETASDPTQGAGPVPAGQVDPSGTTESGTADTTTTDDTSDDGPKGAELDQALKDAGLSTAGSADEKRARLRDSTGS